MVIVRQWWFTIKKFGYDATNSKLSVPDRAMVFWVFSVLSMIGRQ